MSKVLKVDCPTCKKTVTWNEQAKYRPFCSDRCKLIDLGEWASDSYAIPVEFNEENLISLSSTLPEPDTLQ